MDEQTAKEMLETWIEAERAVSLGQSYTIGSRQLTRADAKTITEKINYWSAVVRGFSDPSPRCRRVVY